MFSTSSRRLSVSQAITSLEERVKYWGKGLGGFWGLLLGLWGSAGNTARGASLGIRVGVGGAPVLEAGRVKGEADSAAMSLGGTGCEASPCKERPVKALFKEASRNENALKGLLSHSEV